MTQYYISAAVGNDGNAGTSQGSGNAWATPDHAATIAAAGDTVNWKADSGYTRTSALAFTNAGTFGAPIKWIGYTTTPGDGGKVTVTTSTNSVHLFNTSKAWHWFQGFNCTNTAGTPGAAFAAVSANADHCAFLDCTISGCSAGIWGDNATMFILQNPTIQRCDISGCTSFAIKLYGNNSRITLLNNYIHDNAGATNDGVVLINSGTLGNFILIGNKIARNGRYGVKMGNGTTTLIGAIVIGNAFDSNGSDNLLLSSNDTGDANDLWLENNALWGAGGYNVNLDTSGVWIPWLNQNNAMGGATTADRHNLSAGANDVSLSASPWTAPTSGDYSPNGTAGGGAALKAAGYPLYLDIGAIQSQAAGGGGAILSRAFLGMGSAA